MDIRQRAATAVICTARRWLGSTGVGQLPLAGAIVRRIVRFGYGATEVTSRFRGLELTAPVRSASIAAALVGGFYERLELDLFEELCARNQLVIDVGANLGIYTCLAAALLPTGGLVVAFEPEPENLTALHANLRRNRPPTPAGAGADPARGADSPVEVLVEPLAAGATYQTALLRLEHDGGRHAIAVDGGAGLPVTQVTLDRHVSEILASRPRLRRVDVLKIDVEGYDAHVLHGAQRILANDRPALLIEFSARQLARCGSSAHDFVELLSAAYDKIHIIEETSSRVVSCAPAQLLTERYRNRLVNVAAAARPEHQEILENWAAAHTGQTGRAPVPAAGRG